MNTNIGDIGATEITYSLYKSSNVSSAPKLPGLTRYTLDQTYFLAYANTYCWRYRNHYLRDLIKNNDHPPTEIRINGALMNLPQFAEAFQCKKGDPMNPVKKCSVW